jgi:hypothetical protein
VSRFTSGLGVALTLAGTATAVAGIIEGEFKPVAIGLVLICGATVFAILYLGTRGREVGHAGGSSDPPA